MLGQIKNISFGDKNFPKNLNFLADPPKQLYLLGDAELINYPSVAVVGTRSCTDYGKRVTRDLVQGLVNKDYVVVSGLALGVDSVAHSSAIDFGGRTIAVLGSGFDNVYPKENISLFEQIIKLGGLVVSEHPPEIGPKKHHFPLRNRIISGLSSSLVVVEAPIRSGALITARMALEQGKDVYAVPGNIDSENSAGVNKLIKEGASPITSVSSFLNDLEFSKF